MSEAKSSIQIMHEGMETLGQVQGLTDGLPVAKQIEHEEPGIPRYLRRALESGDLHRVEKCLEKAFKEGYELEFIAQKLGFSEDELKKSIEGIDVKTK